MRHAGNFNPEWGYIAPAPNFLRTTRLFVVAAAIGATASAAVVFSLMDRPAAEIRCGAHVGAASGAAAGAQRSTCGATTNAIGAGLCLADAARRCTERDAAARRGRRRARDLSRCERVGRCVDDAKPTHRCRVGRVSKDHDDGSAARTCAAD